ncbi:hypothetical protein [Sphingomonas abaci]|uniref:DUF2163 domain-containing protein n=1 Tax=Sphingomonas abaci TaxID=237611 RepID=A0A7W7AHE3_9SPHN|nr:hypothetical protein [Sphingomonas abaci]MBB4616901.1 hypothetical protein [Sphingomonas abaci]
MNRNLLLRIDCPDTARIWSGPGPLYLPADGIETTDGALYLGGGELLENFGEIEQLINGTASRLDITVSGVTAATVKLMGETAGVKGARVDIGVVEFDDQWQIQAVTWTAQYRIDKLTATRTDKRTIGLSMGSDDTGRSSTLNAYWTQADQQRRSPDDRFFDQVSGLNAGKSRLFGPK